jgi:predicted MPP superfamily phosphohydrolase
MKRGRNLGREGETEALRLFDSIALTPEFNPCVVLSPHRGALTELCARVQDANPLFQHWEPASNLSERALRLKSELTQQQQGAARQLGAPEPSPVIWVETKGPFSAEAWRPALDALNQQRELFRSDAPWSWILAGPEELQQLIRERAPDLRTGIVTWLTLPEEPTLLVEAKTPLRWLHLSDFHFKEKERWDRRLTLTALLDHAAKLKEEGFVPDLVLITGDVAYSGKRGEYEQAELFLKALAARIGFDEQQLRDRFFIVPGNHDVDQSRIQRSDRSLLRGLGQQIDVEELFNDTAAMRLIGRRLEEFYNFTERLLGPVRAFQLDRPYRADVLPIGGVDVAILQLNSAWASDREPHQLWVGEKQLLEAVAATPGVLARLALVHHPIDELHQVDKARLTELLPSQVDFLLRGHLHDDRTVQVSSPDDTYVELAAGTCYVEGSHPKTHLTAQLDWQTATAEVGFYAYSPRGKGYWHANPGAYEKAKDGRWQFPLAEKFGVTGEAPNFTAGEVSIEVAAQVQATLTTRYRSSVSACYGTVRFIGFSDHRPKPNVRVPELYVPLRMAFQEPRRVPLQGQAFNFRQGGTPESIEPPSDDEALASAPSDETAPTDASTPDASNLLSTVELIKALVAPIGSASGSANEAAPAVRAASRFVILGAPGSGKTTLCRYLAVALAGDTDAQGTQVPATTLPLFIPFRDYLREHHTLGFVDFLVARAKSQLSVHASREFFESALNSGQAVVLLDGFDEVGSADDREAMRDRVAAFLCQYPAAPAVLTSRVAGYDQAPLPREFTAGESQTGFQHLTLVDFDDRQQEAFAEHWYQVQEPNDAQARERGAADLIAALRANRPVRELARNPMLATLVALIHRFEATLPGERAILYELCVRVLLESWPAARGQTFAKIDERRQRIYLEELALSMQERRAARDAANKWPAQHASITILRRELLTALTHIALAQEGLSMGEPGTDAAERASPANPEQVDRARRDVEAWVDYLAEGSGILVEQQPGVFGFFHLSLMEYLAACALRRAPAPLADAIFQHYHQAGWREVCLLAIGHREQATDRCFLDTLFERFARPRSDNDKEGAEPEANPRWDFLLAAMVEEADFNNTQREQVVRGSARNLLFRSPRVWQTTRNSLAILSTFSRRHSQWLQPFLEHELTTAQGDNLRAAVAISLHEPRFGLRGIGHGAATLDPERILARRKDSSRAAAALLEFWPGARVGDWAALNVALDDTIRWGITAPGELALTRSITAFTSEESDVLWQLHIEQALHHIRISAWTAAVFRHARTCFERLPRTGGAGLPTRVTLRSSPFVTDTRLGTVWLHKGAPHSPLQAPCFSASRLAFALASSFNDNIESSVASGFALAFASSFNNYLNSCFYYGFTFAAAFNLELYSYFDSDDESNDARRYGRDFASYFPSFVLGEEVASFASFGCARLECSDELYSDEREDSLRSPIGTRLLRFVHTTSDSTSDEHFPKRRDPRLWRAGFLAQFVGEARASLLVTAEQSSEYRSAYLHYRTQNLWLLHLWPALDEKVTLQTPAQLAHYLALGWTQATTTWEWPDTPRWIALLSGAPPEHWWPRVHWHACWLLYEPNSKERLAALRAALQEGKQDPALPNIARRFEETIGLEE